MTLAEEMLATMPLSDDSSTLLADEEGHIVINESRQAIVPNELKIIAVTGDKDIETITFDCVRFWDGYDLSTFAIYLNYVLPDMTYGTYIPKSITTSDGEDVFHFDWEIKNNITKKSGKISFAVTAVKTKQNENGETVVDKQWSSLPNSDCYIALGLDISNVPDEEESSDVLAQMSAILEQIQSNIYSWIEGVVVQTTGQSETSVMSQKAVTDEISSVVLPQIKGIEVVGNLLPYCAKEVKAGFYCVVSNGKAVFAENARYTSYKIPVEQTIYYLNTQWIVVCDINGNALNSAFDSTQTSINIADYPTASYMWVAVIESTAYVSKFIANKQTAYKYDLNEYLPHFLHNRYDTVSSEVQLINHNSIQKGLCVNASCDIGSDFSTMSVVFIKSGNYSVRVTVTTTLIEIKDYMWGKPHTTTVEHGLTIANNLQISIRYNGKCDVIVDVVSNGVKFSKTSYSIKLGSVMPVLNAVGTVKNLTFSMTCEDIKKDIWMFGDSYFQYSNTRWVYNLSQTDYIDNVLLNYYSGEGSADGYADLKNILDLGRPKYVFWCLGMNDGSDTDEDTPSAVWLENIEKVIALCNGLNITPILATIPSVPNIYHEGKNKWVRVSGFQYVDFAKAVGASAEGVWYDGMLSSDSVHPAAQGGMALYHQVLADFPQIMIK